MNSFQQEKIKNLWQKYFHNQKSSFDFSDLLKKYPNDSSLFHLAESFSPELSEHEVFSDKNTGGCRGLKQYQMMFSTLGKPIYLFDNHNL